MLFSTYNFVFMQVLKLIAPSALTAFFPLFPFTWIMFSVMEAKLAWWTVPTSQITTAIILKMPVSGAILSVSLRKAVAMARVRVR